MATTGEVAAMRRAVALARAALGSTNPNPAVGAVVLDRTGEIVGEGQTQPAGGDHAEIDALTAAGDHAQGGVLVTTLEPCRHHGRTGPCTDAIVRAGIRRVVYAVGDPHDEAGGGAEIMRAAGVDVEADVLVDDALVDLEPWLLATRRRRPHVTWKYAATLDGRTAAADGTSRWITGPESRRDVHRLRAQSDAVLVGIGTVLADDSSLTVRDWPTPNVPTERQPLRVVVDGKARTPLSSHILDDSAPTMIAVGATADERRLKALAAAGAEIVEAPGADGRVDLGALLARLFDRSARLLLVEGGARLAGSFIRERLVDRVVGYYAPALLGAGPPVLADAGIPTIGAAVRLEICDVTEIGGDVRITTDIRANGR